MENLSAIFQGLASLAWPIIVIVVLLIFRTSIKELIETAKSRGWTVKMGGTELTMQEISDQQKGLINDLQKQLLDVQQQIDNLLPPRPLEAALEASLPAGRRLAPANAILWADDNPKNNAFLIQSLQDQGVQIVTALSTREALNKFASARFDRVITDMGRFEEGHFNPTAGLELATQLRATDSLIPIVVYTSSRSAREQRDAALEAGATDITASPTALLNLLQL